MFKLNILVICFILVSSFSCLKLKKSNTNEKTTAIEKEPIYYFRNYATGYYLGLGDSNGESQRKAVLDYNLYHFKTSNNQISTSNGLALSIVNKDTHEIAFVANSQDAWTTEFSTLTGFWTIRHKTYPDLALASVDGYSYLNGVTIAQYNANDIRQRWTLGIDMVGQLWKVVLTWTSLRDLDSHVNLPNGEHVSYQKFFSSDNSVSLDNDDRTGPGHETVHFNLVDRGSTGTYVYYVHVYSPPESIQSSDCKVEVYHGYTLVESIRVPYGGSNRKWKVFQLEKNVEGDVTYSKINTFFD